MITMLYVPLSSLSPTPLSLPNYIPSLSPIHIYHTNQAIFSLSPPHLIPHITPLNLTTLSHTSPSNLTILSILSLSIDLSLSIPISHSPLPPSPSSNSYPPFTPLPLTSIRCLFSRSQEVTCTVSSALSCMRSSLSLLMRRTASKWRSRSRLAHRSSSVRDDLIVDTFHVYRCIY